MISALWRAGKVTGDSPKGSFFAKTQDSETLKIKRL